MAGIDHLIRTDFKAVDKHGELRQVLGWLGGNGGKPPILTDEGRAVGIMNERSLMRRRLDPHTKLDRHMSATRAITPETQIDDIIAKMAEFRAAYLPVVDSQGRPAGYIRALDIARESPLAINAGDACVPVTRLSAGQTLSEALHAFADEYVDVLPVVDPFGRVTGVLRRRTIVQLGAGSGRSRGRMDAGDREDPHQAEVSGFMDNTPHTLPPEASFREVVAQLDKDGYALVRDGHGRFMGLITPETLFERAPVKATK